jgi:hypothetical protein
MLSELLRFGIAGTEQNIITMFDEASSKGFAHITSAQNTNFLISSKNA